MNDHTSPARDRFFALIASIPGSGSVEWCGPARALLDEITAVSAVRPPATDRTALREQIAALFRHPPGRERLGDATPGEIADAVLAVLPAVDQAPPWKVHATCPEREPLIGVQCAKEAGHEVYSDRPGRIWYPEPTDRAAVLREAADQVAALDRRKLGISADTIRDAWEEARDEAKDLLRRMAAEPAAARPDQTDETQGVARVRALHQPMQRGPFTICAHCSGWDGEWRGLGVVTDYPCPTLRALAEPSPAEAEHVGGGANAEDCPACTGTNPPYPFICPGPDAPAVGGAQQQTEA